MGRVKTGMKFGDKDYAFVPERLKAFREENPRAEINTDLPSYQPDGSIVIKTTIIKDRKDRYSAIGTGSARYTAEELKLKKAYEKLETISKGRALSDIGYLNDGQIASTEEMEEFLAHKEEKKLNAIMLAVESLEDAKTLDELRNTYMSLGSLISEPSVIAAKNRKKDDLAQKAKASATSAAVKPKAKVAA